MPLFKKNLSPTLFDLQEIQTAGVGRLLLEALATGLISGFIIGVFRMAYNFVNATLVREFRLHVGTPEGMILTGGAILLCAVIAWLMVRHEPLISGSGIPHVELVLRGKMPMPWRRILWTKFIGTLASLSGGLSVGREGPCIQMGAAVGCGRRPPVARHQDTPPFSRRREHGRHDRRVRRPPRGHVLLL